MIYCGMCFSSDEEGQLPTKACATLAVLGWVYEEKEDAMTVILPD